MFDVEGICFLTLAGRESVVDLLLSKPPYSRRSKLVGREQLRTVDQNLCKLRAQHRQSTGVDLVYLFSATIQYMTIHILLALFG